MDLPTGISPAERIDPRIMLIYGPPKTGKTTIISKLPNHLIIDCEKGAEHVACCKIDCPDLGTFDAIENTIKLKKYPYRFVAVDTIDKIEEWCEWDATKAYKMTLQGKNFTGGSVLNLPNGGGYLWLRQSFIKYFNKIGGLARNVIMIGHIRDKMIDVGGKEVTAKDLDLTGKIRSICCSRADAIGYFSRGKDDKSVNLTFVTADTVNCGSRCEHLKGKSFTFESGAENFDWRQIYKELDKETESMLNTELVTK